MCWTIGKAKHPYLSGNLRDWGLQWLLIPYNLCDQSTYYKNRVCFNYLPQSLV